ENGENGDGDEDGN
ncbi:hypothetical protein CISIN_1g0260311mg, partial [Citrus sinensis]